MFLCILFQDQEALESVPVDHPQEIEDLFDELEDLSDSGPEMDTISVLSTPKPKLRYTPGLNDKRSLYPQAKTKVHPRPKRPHQCK